MFVEVRVGKVNDTLVFHRSEFVDRLVLINEEIEQLQPFRGPDYVDVMIAELEAEAADIIRDRAEAALEEFDDGE